MLGIGMPAGLQPGRSRSGAGRQRLQVLAAVKEKTGKQVVCSKTLVARKEAAAQVQTLCQGIVTYTEDRMRDRTSGIQQYQCMRDGFEDNVFHFYERYASNAHLGRHNTSDEVVKFMTSVQPLLEAPVGMALYEFKNGRLGVAAVQGGPKGEGGLDDATGASGAAGGASMKQTSSSVDLTQIDEEEDEAGLMHAFMKNDGAKEAVKSLSEGAKSFTETAKSFGETAKSLAESARKVDEAAKAAAKNLFKTMFNFGDKDN